MFCSNCGKEIKNDDQFCPFCGARNPRCVQPSTLKYEQISKTNNNGKRHSGFIIFACILIAVCLGLSYYFITKKKKEEKWQTQYNECAQVLYSAMETAMKPRDNTSIDLITEAAARSQQLRRSISGASWIKQQLSEQIPKGKEDAYRALCDLYDSCVALKDIISNSIIIGDDVNEIYKDCLKSYIKVTDYID